MVLFAWLCSKPKHGSARETHCFVLEHTKAALKTGAVVYSQSEKEDACVDR